jgi:hypothetical protein
MGQWIRRFKAALLYGLLVWLIPFVVSVLIYPLKTRATPLFESIMPVALTACVVFFLIQYFRKSATATLREVVVIGTLWLAISVALDLLMFMWGPMKMTLANYIMDIGLTYLIFPIVAIGFGYAMDKGRAGR